MLNLFIGENVRGVSVRRHPLPFSDADQFFIEVAYNNDGNEDLLISCPFDEEHKAWMIARSMIQDLTVSAA